MDNLLDNLGPAYHGLPRLSRGSVDNLRPLITTLVVDHLETAHSVSSFSYLQRCFRFDGEAVAFSALTS